MTRDGISFERRAILNWLDENGVCPVSSNPLLPSNLVANTTLRLEIEQWKMTCDDIIEMEQPMELSKAQMMTRDVQLSLIRRSFPAIGGSAGKGRPTRHFEAVDLVAVLDDAI